METFSVSGKCLRELPMTGQLSNHFVEGMRKIYELEPFIKIGASPATALNAGAKRYKRAS